MRLAARQQLACLVASTCCFQRLVTSSQHLLRQAPGDQRPTIGTPAISRPPLAYQAMCGRRAQLLHNDWWPVFRPHKTGF
ncbi:hypothetical protein MRB53_033152 [Persea americana]|uniref:Uncharacterized protein n=1 Tax=Persea americana TaxID=3435 RepID=A0ACC2KU53_PERAE|nr:hypothetical protein MRB53_033152 [Persea americana]